MRNTRKIGLAKRERMLGILRVLNRGSDGMLKPGGVSPRWVCNTESEPQSGGMCYTTRVARLRRVSRVWRIDLLRVGYVHSASSPLIRPSDTFSPRRVEGRNLRSFMNACESR